MFEYIGGVILTRNCRHVVFYKEPMSYDQGFKIIEKNAGSHFDPVIAKIFVENREKMIEVNESYLEEQKRHLNDDSDNDIEILEILEEV